MLSRIGNPFCRAGTPATIVIAIAIAIGFTLASGASAASTPKAVDFWGIPPNAVAVRPATLGWTTDLGPSFNGTRGSDTGRGPNSKLSWSSWGASSASGSGDLWVPREHGTSISWKRYPAKLAFSAPKTLGIATNPGATKQHSVLVFTRIKVSFAGAVPAHWHRSASFTLKKVSSGFYGFAFPR